MYQFKNVNIIDNNIRKFGGKKSCSVIYFTPYKHYMVINYDMMVVPIPSSNAFGSQDI